MGKDDKQTLTPRLRFPEFREAKGWKETPLKEICEINPANSGLPESFVYIDLESVEGGVLNARKLIEKKDAPSRAQRLLKNGDVVFQIVRPYQRNNLFVRFNDDETYVASTGYAQLRANESESFLYQVVHTDPFVDRVIAQCTGSSYPAINSADLADVLLPVPPSVSEQQKIADCLTSLDELLAAQGRKVEALQAHKKGLMQQLFPREGETLPRLRFPEFRDGPGWEIITFGKMGFDVSDGNYSSKYPRQSDFVSVGVPFLRANNLSRGSISDKDMKFISKKQHNQITKGHLKQGDILLSNRGQIGTVALVPDRHIGSNINAQLVRINTGEKSDNVFIFQLLDGYSRSGVFESLSTGTALKQLPIGKLNGLELILPRQLEEQQQIADCLSGLDAQIAAEASKLAALKTHKQGLMQQLFPNPQLSGSPLPAAGRGEPGEGQSCGEGLS
ncbi:MAG: restriction endonuclease subunit S [Planctomycetes bacterium]|nr:restriction endonuclease subunit S [Planctomycetota bacterium]